MKECFCGCGRRIPRFPLGTRAINKRGQLVVERLAWARAVVPDEASSDWFRVGEEIVRDLRSAMHGELDPRSLDESYVFSWQQTGMLLEIHAAAEGRATVDYWLAHSAGATPGAPPHAPAAQLGEIRSELCRRAGVDPAATEQQDVISSVQMVEVGAEMLRRLAEDDSLFPAADTDTKRVGMQYLRSALGSPASADASIFLTHALATFFGFVFLRTRAESGDSPEGLRPSYWEIRDHVLSEVFPLSEVDQTRLQQCAHVYRAFDGLSTSDTPPEVPGYPTPPGSMGGTAIELHGDDPNNSPEDVQQLLEGTRLSAEWHFLLEAQKHAVHIAVGTEAYATIAEGMTHVWDMSFARLQSSLYFKEAWMEAFRPFWAVAEQWTIDDDATSEPHPQSTSGTDSEDPRREAVEEVGWVLEAAELDDESAWIDERVAKSFEDVDSQRFKDTVARVVVPMAEALGGGPSDAERARSILSPLIDDYWRSLSALLLERSLEDGFLEVSGKPWGAEALAASEVAFRGEFPSPEYEGGDRVGDALRRVFGLRAEDPLVRSVESSDVADIEKRVLARVIGGARPSHIEADVATALSLLSEVSARLAIAVLESGDDYDREEAIHVLGALGDSKDVATVAKWSGDGEASVREAVAKALGRLQSPDGIDALLTLSRDSEEVVRWEALRGLAGIGDARSRQQLTQALHGDDAFGAARSLRRLGDEDAIRILLEALDSRHEDARIFSESALAGGAVISRPVITALRHSKPDVRLRAIRVISEVHASVSADGRLLALFRAAGSAGEQLLRANSEAAAALEALLADEDEYVRDAAEEALREMGRLEGRPRRT